MPAIKLKPVFISKIDRILPQFLAFSAGHSSQVAKNKNLDKAWNLHQTGQLLFDLSRNTHQTDQRQVIAPVLSGSGQHVANVTRYGSFVAIQPTLFAKASNTVPAVAAELMRVLPEFGYNNATALVSHGFQQAQLAKIITKQDLDYAYGLAPKMHLSLPTQQLGADELAGIERQSAGYHQMLQLTGNNRAALTPYPGATWGKRPNKELEPELQPRLAPEPQPSSAPTLTPKFFM